MIWASPSTSRGPLCAASVLRTLVIDETAPIADAWAWCGARAVGGLRVLGLLEGMGGSFRKKADIKRYRPDENLILFAHYSFTTFVFFILLFSNNICKI
ncbi:MAG: hypothetical protein IPO14_05665 [Saprospiraceae bacterium]|nr:hypothetical protein [Saprospiraceae bacterium]